MDEAFDKLKQTHKNTVDILINWMKESKLIDETKAAEEKARKLFSDVKNVSDVELVNFKKALSKLAEEKKKTVAEMSKMLTDQAPKLLAVLQEGLNEAVTAGVSAITDAVKDAVKDVTNANGIMKK